MILQIKKEAVEMVAFEKRLEKGDDEEDTGSKMVAKIEYEYCEEMEVFCEGLRTGNVVIIDYFFLLSPFYYLMKLPMCHIGGL